MKGTIKYLSPTSNFGFISQSSTGHQRERADVFFHANSLQGVEFHELKHNQKVECQVQNTDKGLKATSVRLAGTPQE